jgi:hypothetical protein
MRRHSIVSDESLNKQLKEDVQDLRGCILGSAEKQPLPDRFTVTASKDKPEMIITDNKTGKSTLTPLFAYGEVRRVLSDLFN